MKPCIAPGLYRIVSNSLARDLLIHKDEPLRIYTIRRKYSTFVKHLDLIIADID
jgi:hypothetical protein